MYRMVETDRYKIERLIKKVGEKMLNGKPNKNRTDKRSKLLNSQRLKVKDTKKNERIEILDFEETTKYEKRKTKLKFHIKNRFKFSMACLVIISILLTGISLITGKNVAVVGVKEVLNGLGIYTEEVRNVEIHSDNYNEPGSWHIDKSAKWIGSHTAQVTFDVQSVMKADDRYKDIILVLDVSGSMAGEKLEKAISDSKELVSYLLSDPHNKVAIVTFESISEIVSNFTNDKEILLEKLNSLTYKNNTNYNAALQNVDIVMNDYVKESNRDVVALFLTDGYPNEDTPNQVGTYEALKDKYSYIRIHGVQYEMGVDVIEEIKQITDLQWVADQSTLNNVLFEASISPIVYEDFIVTDYIHDDYFKINSVDDIKVTKGSVKLEEESGVQKITWNLGSSFMTGGTAKMEINVILKEQYFESKGVYPTNKKEKIVSKLPEENEKIINSSNTPVLKNSYEVIYDVNTPEGCTLGSIDKEKYFIYQNVTKKETELSCDNYLFKGWKIDEEDAQDIKNVNDDIFVMPSHDVTIRATWTKQTIEKSMNGTVYEKTTLYKVLENEAKEGIYAKEYTGAHQDSMDASKSTQKIYHWYAAYSDTAKGTEILNKNNVLFAGHCWQMMRTTDTGGVKMIYNGEAENDKCLNTRGTHVGYGYRTSTNLSSNYWYGTDYSYDVTTQTFKVDGTTEQATWDTATAPSLIGKYTCKLTTEYGTCSTLYLVESYNDASSGYIIPLNSNSHYSQFGELQLNSKEDSPVYVGYMYNPVYPHQYILSESSGKLEVSEDAVASVDLSAYKVKHNDTTYPYTYDEATKQWSSSNHVDSSNSIFEFSPTVAGEYFLSYTIGSENKYDKAIFYVDGVSKDTVSGSGTSVISLGTLTTSSVIRVLYSKDGSSSTQPDKVSFNLATLKGETIEAVGSSSYTVKNNDTTYPYIYDDATKQWSSSNHVDSSKSTFEFSPTVAGEYYLSYTIGSESGWDKATFYVDGTSKETVSGSSTSSISLGSLTTSSVIKVEYSKDGSRSTQPDKVSFSLAKAVAVAGVVDNRWIFGNDVIYNNGTYTLVNTKLVDLYSESNNLRNNHYTCFSKNESCTTVNYIYSSGSYKTEYIELTNGKKVEDAINEMFYGDNVNTVNSIIKTGVETWYKKYLLSYDNYLEDTIFCNNRSISSLGGWHPNGGNTYNGRLNFKEYYGSNIVDLSCTNVTDRFSVSNSRAKLMYKVGLMTTSEMAILNNYVIRKTGKDYWLSTPNSFENNADVWHVSSSGDKSIYFANYTKGVRPAISLKPGTEYSDGDGSMKSPYIVE